MHYILFFGIFMNDKLLTLRTIYENEKVSQRDIAREIDISLGKANSIFKELVDEGLIEKNSSYKVTKSGINILENYKVDNLPYNKCDNIILFNNLILFL